MPALLHPGGGGQARFMWPCDYVGYPRSESRVASGTYVRLCRRVGGDRPDEPDAVPLGVPTSEAV